MVNLDAVLEIMWYGNADLVEWPACLTGEVRYAVCFAFGVIHKLSQEWVERLRLESESSRSFISSQANRSVTPSSSSQS